MRNHVLIILWLAITFATGCREQPAGTSGSAATATEPRIVSLSPAISRTLVDLELDHLIVGRTPFCDALNHDIPVVGDLHDLNYEALIRVRPTHILIQPPASGVNTQLVQLAQERGWSLHMWRLERLEDIATLIGDLPSAIFQEDLETQSNALERSLALIEQFIELQEVEARRALPPTTLLLVGVDPVTAFGTETYLHEVLLMVGGRNAAQHASYPQYTLEDISKMNPQQVILVRPNAATNDLAPLGPILSMNIDAVNENRLAVLTHPDALLPSSGVIGVAEELREILDTFQNNDEAADGHR